MTKPEKKEKIEMTRRELEHILMFSTDVWICVHESHKSLKSQVRCRIYSKYLSKYLKERFK